MRSASRSRRRASAEPIEVDEREEKMKPPRRLNIALALAAGAMLAAPAADARITKIVVDNALSQKPTFGGFSWPGVGQDQKIIGTAYGELNPADPRNSVIVHVQLSPPNPHRTAE